MALIGKEENTDYKVLAISEAFADDNLNITLNIEFVFYRLENIVGKGSKCWLSAFFCFSQDVFKRIFVESTFGGQDIVVTTTVQCVCVCVCVCVCLYASPSEFVQTITSTVVDGFQNNLTQLFCIMSRCAN